VELEAGDGDDVYLRRLRERLPEAFDRARPDLVFYLAGADTLAADPLTELAMTPEGVAARDRFVFAHCARRRLPVVMLPAGGYSPDAWRVQYAAIRHAIETHGD